VLEDWLLEQGGWQAEMVAAERARNVRDAAEARGRGAKLMFGSRHGSVMKAMRDVNWRAGFVRECDFELERPASLELLEQLIASPASRLLEGISFELDAFGPEAVLPVLAPIAGRLRRLGFVGELQAGWTLALDGSFTALERLEVLGALTLQYAPSLRSLRSLKLSLEHLPYQEHLRELLSQDFSSLRELELVARAREPIAPALDRLRELSLERVSVIGSDDLRAWLASQLPGKVAV
jgi:hypothetical protein